MVENILVKEVRDLAEHLKLLGYPHPFPLQALSSNFGCLASFYVVAEVIQWLAGLLEPGITLAGNIHTQEERVLLIRSGTEFFVTKSAVKLNPRKLYAASAVTAAELQKITRLLIAPEAIDISADEENYHSLNQVDIGDKMNDLRKARELSSELTQRGAILHDLLLKEVRNKEIRLSQTNRHLELSGVERTLKNAIASAQLKLQSNRAQLENARIELNALNSKLQRKRAELDRTKQRLEALQKIRPAHMQEFEEYEKELKILFQHYFLRLHVRDALKAQFEARTKRATPASSPILQKPAENSIPFLPEGLLADDDEDVDDDEPQLEDGVPFGLDAETSDVRDEDMTVSKTHHRFTEKRPGTATITNVRGRKNATATIKRGKERPSCERRKDNEYEDSSFGSSDSELDMAEILGEIGSNRTAGLGVISKSNLNELEDDDDFDLNSMESISISKITGDLPLRPKTAAKPEHHSDEDF
ncbi:clusterin associated protein 1 [Glossina fuscipes fuscipes]